MSGILIVDDYAQVRSTIRSLLAWHEMHVCGEAKNGKEAIEQVKALNPDLVLPESAGARKLWGRRPPKELGRLADLTAQALRIPFEVFEDALCIWQK